MLRRLLCLLWCAGLCLSVACAHAAMFPRTARDSRGRALTLRAAPRRIVSLAPGTTEMLYALGLGKAVVGDTVYCDYPPAAQKVTKIGDVTASYEKILALRPDLIVATDANAGAAARLTQLHQPVFTLAPTSFLTTEQSLRLLGHLTGKDAQAQTVVAGMEAKRWRAAAIAAHDPTHRPRVLVVIGLQPLWTAGRETFINDILVRAGGVNAAQAVRGYAPFSPEAVLANPPSQIMAGPKDQAALRADPIYRALPAVRQGRFFSVAPDILNRPGPRLADALLQIARALHPGVK